MPTTPAALPELHDVSPAEVRRRLGERCLVVRSVWFPTPKEIQAWASSGQPVYVRFLAADRAEIGPRLQSMWASCFSPVDVLSFKAELSVRRRFPWMTAGVIAVWWFAAAVWGASGVPRVIAGEESPAWLVFWIAIVAFTTLGPWVGWIKGGQALDEARAWWVEALSVPRVDEDWSS